MELQSPDPHQLFQLIPQNLQRETGTARPDVLGQLEA